MRSMRSLINLVETAGEALREGIQRPIAREALAATLERHIAKLGGSLMRTGMSEPTKLHYLTNEKVADYFESAKMTQFLKERGWLVSLIDDEDESFHIELEPYRSTTSAVPDRLYHVTLAHHLPAIQRHGLLPKPGNKRATHPARVYFATSRFAALQMVQSFCGDMGFDTKLATVEIEPPAGMKFYSDPYFANGRGVYTVQPVPASAIRDIKHPRCF